MALTLSRIVFGILPSRVLNILISHGGDGNMLSQLDDVFLSTTIHKEFTFSSFALISSQLLISGLVRYVLGHVVATLLIVEIARMDGAVSDQERGNSKQPLTFRSISKAIRLVYDTQSLYAFSCALVMAVVYQVTHYMIRVCLELAIFRHQLLIPFAYACSSVLLWKFHLIWTCATISAHRTHLVSLKGHTDQIPWTRLAVPSFTYGLCQSLMSEAHNLIKSSLISPGNEMPISTGRRAGAEICAVIIMLALRLLGLLPASIALILTETSLLPVNLETIIPSPKKKRGSTIAELFGGSKFSPGLAAFSSASKTFGLSQILWLIGLHLKKCLVQIAIELLTLPFILFGIH